VGTLRGESHARSLPTHQPKGIDMGIVADRDDQLVARAADGDNGALGALLDRHLHPAWRIALAASADATAAAAAVTTGFCDALVAADRHHDATISLRTRIAGAVHRAAAADSRIRRATAPPSREPVLAAFATLPVASRTALWLTEVEGGAPDQICPVLGLDRTAAAALVDRAATALRDRLAATGAAAAGNPECSKALGQLPAHAAGRLTEAERGAVGEHLAGCGSCAGWLAAVVAPRPALRRLVVPIPDGLLLAIAERWAEVSGRDRRTWLHGRSERAVAAAAASVLAVGLAGAAFFGRGENAGPELAAPAGNLDLGDDLPDDDVELPTPVVPPAPAPSSTSTRSSTLADRDRAGDAPEVKAPAAPTPTTAPPTTAPPANDPVPAEGGDDLLPLPDLPLPLPGDDTGEEPSDGGETVDLGVLKVEVGEEPSVEVAVPGLPPISLP
jgi:hypothetical protein